MALVALVALVAPRGVVRVALVAQEALVAPCEVVHVSPSRARVFRSRPLVLLVAMRLWDDCAAVSAALPPAAVELLAELLYLVIRAEPCYRQLPLSC